MEKIIKNRRSGPESSFTGRKNTPTSPALPIAKILFGGFPHFSALYFVRLHVAGQVITTKLVVTR